VHAGNRGPFVTPEEFPAFFGQGWALPKPQPSSTTFSPSSIPKPLSPSPCFPTPTAQRRLSECSSALYFASRSARHTATVGRPRRHCVHRIGLHSDAPHQADLVLRLRPFRDPGGQNVRPPLLLRSGPRAPCDSQPAKQLGSSRPQSDHLRRQRRAPQRLARRAIFERHEARIATMTDPIEAPTRCATGGRRRSR
jgi:hypothetical protein